MAQPTSQQQFRFFDSGSGYLEATRKILARHAGLRLIDEAFVVIRKHG